MASPILESQFDVLEMTQERKYELLSVLNDSNLTYKLPGQNMTLGELCKEMGEVQQSYIEGFRTRKMDFEYKSSEAAYSTSVSAIIDWYRALDVELISALKALDGVGVEKETVQRPEFAPPILVNLHIFREGLLIFYGKASIYLRALEITPPPMFQAWIG